MARRGKKITPVEWERIKRLRGSHGVAAAASAVSRSKSVIYKLERKDKHFEELAETMLLIAKNLDKYRKVDAAHIGSPNIAGPAVYGEDCVASTLTDLDEVDREKARDLLSHVKAILPELQGLNIQDEPKDWIDIEDDAIPASFVNRLEIIAHKGIFKGKCDHCPK
ncbi:hypothetical protein ACFLWY_05050 [Chloroflexota bacterium]